MSNSAKPNVQVNPNVAFVVDEVTANAWWAPTFWNSGAWLRPRPGLTTFRSAPPEIRIHPRRIISFNVDPDNPGFQARNLGPNSGGGLNARHRGQPFRRARGPHSH